MLKSQQVEVRGDTFEIKDNILTTGGKVFHILEFATVKTQDHLQRQKTFFRGKECVPLDEIDLGVPVFRMEGEVGEWVNIEAIDRMVFLHHRCGPECSITKVCQHQRCPPSCANASYHIRHENDHIFLVDVEFRLLK